MKRRFLILFITFLSAWHASGQLSIATKFFTAERDSNYIKDYSKDFTTRIFNSIKYSMMAYDDNTIHQRLVYKPNNKMLLGFGANHGFLGINIGINFPFINQDDDRYGETEYNDLTMRIYSPRFNSNIYLQRYKGFFLRNTGAMIKGWEEGDPYYIREDIRSYTAGLDITYIFNSKRFSYRAAVVQTEWQIKSAGSMLVGGSLIYQTTIGDSSIVPSQIINPSFYDGNHFDRSSNFSIGPIIGYAYTFVWKKHLFITGSASGSANLGLTSLHLTESQEKFKSGTILGFRAEILLSAGYNSELWYFGLSYVNMTQTNQAPIPEKSIGFDTGMFRMNAVRRIHAAKPIRLLNPGLEKF